MLTNQLVKQKQSESKHTLSLPDNCLSKEDFRLYGQIGIANQSSVS